MTPALSALLQLAMSLLIAAQSNPSLPTLQKQQAILIATQVTQIATQALQGLPVASSTTAAVAVGTGLPVRLVIPKLNINAAFQYDGLTPSGTMETPTNVSDVGWFTGSSLPGKAGVAIVIGHVAQIRRGVVTKQGVFSDLGALSAGDTFSVVNDEGATTNFVVRKSRTYDPTADATDVFTSTDGGAHLNFITCEGTWNQAQLEYTQRLVVFADAVQ
jgi:sortase (surface protein transpeptidase)